jgi:hypothetical protein
MAENGATIPQDPSHTEDAAVESKGKGKAVAEEVPQDAAMDEDDDDDDDDDDDEEDDDEVRKRIVTLLS